MVHIIANPYVFKFDTVANKGAFVPPGGFLSTDPNYVWCDAVDPTSKKCGVYNSAISTASAQA